MPSAKEVIENNANVEEIEGEEWAVVEHPYGENCPVCGMDHAEKRTMTNSDGEEVVVEEYSTQKERVLIDNLAQEYDDVPEQALDAQSLKQEMENRGMGHGRFIQVQGQ